MSKTQTAKFTPLRISLPWCPSPRFENYLEVLAVSIERFGYSEKECYAMYITTRIGLLSRCSEVGDTWVLMDGKHPETLFAKLTSLSAN